jgi:hypothetical protein
VSASKIMLIRHAEKPDHGSGGIDVTGRPDDADLSVLGWQRAGALAVLFAPGAAGFADPGLATPAAIFAAAGDRPNHSRRSHSTIVPLAHKLGLTEDVRFYKGQEQAVAHAALASDGVVLIAWEHKLLPLIGHVIMGDTTTCPAAWPSDCFDVIWLFDRTAAGWCFQQRPQRLLAGDRASVIAHAG